MPVITILVNTSNPDLLNGTYIELGTRGRYKDSEFNELLYVVIVIMFYATALMVLIATQIRKQRREGPEVEYYDDKLERKKKCTDQLQSQAKVMARLAQHGQASVNNDGDVESVIT